MSFRLATEAEIYQLQRESLRGLTEPREDIQLTYRYSSRYYRDDDDSMSDYELLGIDPDDCGGLDPWTANGMD